MTAKRIPGATTYYRLEEDGTVVVRQGTEETDPVRLESGAALRSIKHITTTSDNGVFALHLLGHWYEIGRDDIARPVEAAEYERRRDAPRGYNPLDWQ